MSLTTPQLNSVLKTTFGYDSFRPLQEECIASVLDKQDALLLMPTGGGKSLCYQIPALLFDGLTVVISPLISLMKDQMMQLKALGIEAEVLNSTLSFDEYEMNKMLVRSGQTKLLFMAPETLVKGDIQALLSSVRMDCLTIDEAHCISEWGHDFRPEYRQINTIRQQFPEAVCLAMTATATPRVQKDILTNLELNNPREFLAGFNRDNLFYEVIPKQSPVEQTLDFLKRFKDQSGIIYCFSRKQVESLTAQINANGFKALPYHAGLTNAQRHRHQELFIRDDVPIMVATIAFGMGINKPNVRFVVHFDLPKNIESYYQETGRAGRDGLPSHCLLLFGYGDIHKIKFFIGQKSDATEKSVALAHLNSIVHYAESEVCRRKPLITYFGEDYTKESCGLCDNCVNPKQAEFDMTLPARKFLTCVARTGQRFGATHVIDVLRGSQSQKVLNYEHQELDVHGIGKEFSVRQWQFLLRQLLQQELLDKEEEYGVLKLNTDSLEILHQRKIVMGYPPPVEKMKSKAPKPSLVSNVSDEYDQNLFETLRAKRKELADRKGVPPYVIFPDKSLIDMAARRPKTIEEFSTIFGVGAKKLEAYGEIFLRVIKGEC